MAATDADVDVVACPVCGTETDPASHRELRENGEYEDRVGKCPDPDCGTDLTSEFPGDDW